MSERTTLLKAVADTIKTYRRGQLAEPTPQHVDRWLSQFTPEHQLPFLREFAHVIEQTFITEDNIRTFLSHLVTNKSLAGQNQREFWSSAYFLDIQSNGQSQSEMLRCFSESLESAFGFSISECGKEGGDYIYLDDIMFSGNRVGNDLEKWIISDAPPTATVHVIVAANHTLSTFQCGRRLKEVIKDAGKSIKITYWRLFEFENRKTYKNKSQVLWPASLPNDPNVNAYMSLPSRFPLETRVPVETTGGLFSSEAGRSLLETEFLIAGAKIIAMNGSSKESLRPLGYSSFGVGFGSIFVTYRNCPNNCPLAMWWGDPNVSSGALNWYPLLPREVYSSPRRAFSGFKFS